MSKTSLFDQSERLANVVTNHNLPKWRPRNSSLRLLFIIARESHAKTRYSYIRKNTWKHCVAPVWCVKKAFESDKKVLQTLDESKTRGLAEGCILDSAHDSCIFSAAVAFCFFVSTSPSSMISMGRNYETERGHKLKGSVDEEERTKQKKSYSSTPTFAIWIEEGLTPLPHLISCSTVEPLFDLTPG